MDRQISRGDYSVETTNVLGREYSGTVLQGANDVSGLRVSDGVVIDSNVVDYNYLCRRGHSHIRRGLSLFGVARSGDFAELSVIPARHLYSLLNNLSFAYWALVEALACCVRGIDQAGFSGDTVVVADVGRLAVSSFSWSDSVARGTSFRSNPLNRVTSSRGALAPTSRASLLKRQQCTRADAARLGLTL